MALTGCDYVLKHMLNNKNHNNFKGIRKKATLTFTIISEKNDFIAKKKIILTIDIEKNNNYLHDLLLISNRKWLFLM